MPYFPGKPPQTQTDDGAALGFYLEDELSRLASSLLDDVQAVEVRPAHAAPLRPRAGMLVYADGTDWDPGFGEGLYTYGSDAAWHLAGRDGASWIAYTPTITAAAGTFTTTSGAIRYKQMGKLVFFSGTITITTIGTGTFPKISLPVAAAVFDNRPIGIGRENALTGKFFDIVAVSASQGQFFNYDNSSPASGSGNVLVFSGTYEAA